MTFIIVYFRQFQRLNSPGHDLSSVDSSITLDKLPESLIPALSQSWWLTDRQLFIQQGLGFYKLHRFFLIYEQEVKHKL